MKTSLPRRRALLALAAALPLAGALTPMAAQAQAAWPEHALTFIVPGAPGGTTDTPTRLLARKLSVLLGQPVVVENRAGSGGILGAQTLLRAPADGYTVLVGNTGSHAINYSAYKQLPYKPQDFIALTDLISFPNVLVVNAQSPIKRVADLVAKMKSEPGKVAFSSAGIGQTTHLTGEMFKMRTGTEAIHVPYKGSTPAMVALLSNETTFLFDNLTQSLPQIRAGKLRALAVTSAERQSALPDVPTMAQAGIEDFVVTGWLGLFVAANTPPAIVEKLYASVTKALADPEVVATFREMGGIPGGQSSAKFTAFVAKENERWGQTIKKSNLSFD